MAGKTVSAYVDEGAVKRMMDVARSEDRSPAQVAGAGIKFYSTLGKMARDAIRVIDAHGTDADIEWMRREVTRVMLRTQHAIADRLAAAALNVPIPAEATDADILDIADEILGDGAA